MPRASHQWSRSDYKRFMLKIYREMTFNSVVKFLQRI